MVCQGNILVSVQCQVAKRKWRITLFPYVWAFCGPQFEWVTPEWTFLVSWQPTPIKCYFVCSLYFILSVFCLSLCVCVCVCGCVCVGVGGWEGGWLQHTLIHFCYWYVPFYKSNCPSLTCTVSPTRQAAAWWLQDLLDLMLVPYSSDPCQQRPLCPGIKTFYSLLCHLSHANTHPPTHMHMRPHMHTHTHTHTTLTPHT